LYASVSSALRQRSSASSSVSSYDGFDVVVFDEDDEDDDPSYPYVQSNPFFSRCNGRRPDVRRNASARRSRDDAPYDVDASSSSTSSTSFVCDALEDAQGGHRDRADAHRRTHRRPTTTFGDADAHDVVVAPDAHRIVD
jgi:hypothetical protein